MTLRPASAPPDVRRADSRAVHVAQRWFPDRDAALAALAEAAEQWRTAGPPPGLLSFNGYLDTEDDTVLTYAQTDGTVDHRSLTAGLSGLAGAATVEYRLDRALVLGTGTPTAFVVATFDVDGPGPQQHIVDSITAAVEQAPAARHPGLLSANFHLSTDGSRVLNYAEWTDDRSHEEFLAGATRTATLAATHRTPGVRPIGFKRYRLLHSLTA